jgi:hypothetical protein
MHLSPSLSLQRMNNRVCIGHRPLHSHAFSLALRLARRLSSEATQKQMHVETNVDKNTKQSTHRHRYRRRRRRRRFFSTIFLMDTHPLNEVLYRRALDRHLAAFLTKLLRQQ